MATDKEVENCIKRLEENNIYAYGDLENHVFIDVNDLNLEISEFEIRFQSDQYEQEQKDS